MNSVKFIFQKDVLWILVTVSIFLLLVIYQNTRTKWNISLKTNRTKNKTLILLWTSPNNPPSASQMSRLQSIVDIMNGQEGQHICEETCEFSLNRKFLDKSSAIVFFMFTYGLTLSDLPKKRNDNQLWVMHALEPPPYLWWKDPLKNQFNWSMTYRTDSDIWIPYGKVVPRKINIKNISIQNISLDNWINRKNKLAAAVISRCDTSSKREILIERLNKSIGIDLYGKCGKMPSCGGVFSKTCANFWTDLSTNYKFYLAFENSICKDYITEKFWRSLELGMVPVVYGGGIYLKEAPPGSYISIQDFKSVEELAGFLKNIGKNVTKYGKYFEWRKKYRILNKEESIIKDWCSLCKKVRNHVINIKGYRKSYTNSKLWWQGGIKGNYTRLACPKSHKFFN